MSTVLASCRFSRRLGASEASERRLVETALKEGEAEL